MGITLRCDEKAVTGMPGVCSDELVASTMKDGRLTDAERIALIGS